MTASNGDIGWLNCKCGGTPYHRRDTRSGVVGRHVECKDCGFFMWWESSDLARSGWNEICSAVDNSDDAPDKIWVWHDCDKDGWENAYASTNPTRVTAAAYIRSDLAAEARITELERDVQVAEAEVARLTAELQAEDAFAEDMGERWKMTIAEADHLRAENDRLRVALAQIDIGQSAEPDHWQFRCRAREIARAALQRKAGE